MPLQHILDEVYEACKKEVLKPKKEIINQVKKVFEDFTPEQISKKIAEMLKTDDINAEIEIIYQSIGGLHEAVPNDTGDWYFTGDYPTCGGMKVVNTAFINYMEGNNKRAY